MVGCACPVCASPDPRDKRTRASVLLKTRSSESEDWEYLLIDTSIDLRQQLLREGAPPVFRVVYTHSHVDHFFGLDELRAVQFVVKRPIEVFGSAEIHERVRAVYTHLFDPNAQSGGGILSVRLHPAEGRFTAGGFGLQTLQVLHGKLPVQGYRWGSLAYITDCSAIPEQTWKLLAGVDTLVLDALRKRPHETHFNIDQALEVVARLGPRRTYFIHMTHDLLHAETNAELPEGVELAYDGLELELPSFDPLNWEMG
ncbi:MAG: Ribonuclease BN [bacterium]|nr:Ribonuclease BN [bacterium]